jgi:hypothetical protein
MIARKNEKLMCILTDDLDSRTVKVCFSIRYNPYCNGRDKEANVFNEN